jgi:hypothetical protein
MNKVLLKSCEVLRWAREAEDKLQDEEGNQSAWSEE